MIMQQLVEYNHLDDPAYADTSVLSKTLWIRYVHSFSRGVSMAIELCRCRVADVDDVYERCVLMERDWCRLKQIFTQMSQIIRSKKEGSLIIPPNPEFTDITVTLTYVPDNEEDRVEMTIYRSCDHRQDTFVLTTSEWETLVQREADVVFTKRNVQPDMDTLPYGY